MAVRQRAPFGTFSSAYPHRFWRFVLEAASLQTPRGRVTVFGVLSTLIFVSPYSWLAHLSLWQKLGWNTAPSIGLTRAYWLLLHGNPVAAWHRNKLIYVVLLIGLPLIIGDVYRVAQRRLQKRV